jgi:hypothetical protein
VLPFINGTGDPDTETSDGITERHRQPVAASKPSVTVAHRFRYKGKAGDPQKPADLRVGAVLSRLLKQGTCSSSARNS